MSGRGVKRSLLESLEDAEQVNDRIDGPKDESWPPLSPSDFNIKDEEDDSKVIVKVTLDPEPDLIVSPSDVEILSASSPKPTTSGASNVVGRDRTSAPPPPKLSRSEKIPPRSVPPTTKVIDIPVLISYLEAFITPDGLFNKGNWAFKFTRREEIVAIVESVILFVSKNDETEGLQLFGDDNLDPWKILGSNSTSAFFTSFLKNQKNHNLFEKYASWSVISKDFPIFPKFLKCLAFFVYYLYQAKGQDLKKLKGQNLIVGQILKNVATFKQDVFPGQNNAYRVRLDFQKLGISPESFPRAVAVADAESEGGQILTDGGSQTPKGEGGQILGVGSSQAQTPVGKGDPLLPLVYNFAADLRKRADDYGISVKKLARNVEECYELREKLRKKVLESRDEHAKSSGLREDLVQKVNFQGAVDFGNNYQSENGDVVEFLTRCENEPGIYDEIIDRIGNVFDSPERRQGGDDVEESMSKP